MPSLRAANPQTSPAVHQIEWGGIIPQRSYILRRRQKTVRAGAPAACQLFSCSQWTWQPSLRRKGDRIGPDAMKKDGGVSSDLGHSA